MIGRAGRRLRGAELLQLRRVDIQPREPGIRPLRVTITEPIGVADQRCSQIVHVVPRICPPKAYPWDGQEDEYYFAGLTSFFTSSACPGAWIRLVLEIG